MNEGRKSDKEKIRYELIPVSLDKAVATILTYGAKKYADRNWEKGIAWSRCYGALQRHITAWWGGEDLDAETGKSHLWHAACELAFLIEFETTRRNLDDRPVQERSHDTVFSASNVSMAHSVFLAAQPTLLPGRRIDNSSSATPGPDGFSVAEPEFP